jgi:formylglycine-generating enzyme required for sulfatase activity
MRPHTQSVSMTWPRGALRIALVAVGIVACSHSPSGPTAPSADEVPGRVSIAGGQLVSGTASGVLRENYSMAGFGVSKYPVTVAEYRECVAAGACSEPASQHAECVAPGPQRYLDRATYGVKGGDKLPVTCTLLEQARAYCQWVGGDLPTLAQWELAARGSQPSEFPWGAVPPTCPVHPAVGESFERSPCSRETASVIPNHSVGAHHDGASPTGVEDVLLTRGELIVASSDAQFSSCQPPMTGCTASGARPGAIETFVPIVAHPAESEKGISGTTAGFRCVWSNSK